MQSSRLDGIDFLSHCPAKLRRGIIQPDLNAAGLPRQSIRPDVPEGGILWVKYARASCSQLVFVRLDPANLAESRASAAQKLEPDLLSAVILSSECLVWLQVLS